MGRLEPVKVIPGAAAPVVPAIGLATVGTDEPKVGAVVVNVTLLSTLVLAALPNPAAELTLPAAIDSVIALVLFATLGPHFMLMS